MLDGMLPSSVLRASLEQATARYEQDIDQAADFLLARGIDRPQAVSYRRGGTSDVRRAWVPGNEGRYSVTADGKVWSHRPGRAPRALAPGRGTPYGHRKVTLGCGFGGSQWVHRLVLLAFVGEPPSGSVARHLDGDPSNNRLANLAWGTPGENNADMVRHGRSTRGTANARAKLTETDVRAIRSATEPLRVLSERYGVAMSTLSQIRTGKLWGWLDA